MTAPVERRKEERGARSVRFALMMLVALIASYAAWQAHTAADRAGFAARRANGVASRADSAAALSAVAAAQAKAVAAQATAFAAAVQAQRKASIQRACTDQNARHDATIHALDIVIGGALRQRGTTRARRIEIRASRASTMLIINALDPVQNCAALVAAATGP